jgi:hypothetical protein
MEEPLHVYLSLPFSVEPAAVAAAAGPKPKQIVIVIVINELFLFGHS